MRTLLIHKTDSRQNIATLCKWICLSILLLWLSASHAITVYERMPGIHLEEELSSWQDSSRLKNIHQVALLRDQGLFKKQSSHALGYSKNAVWFSFTLTNPSAATLRQYVEYTEAQIGEVSLYSRPVGGKWQVQYFNAEQSAAHRPLATIRPVFLQSVPAHTQLEVLMRVTYSDQPDMAGPIMADVRLWGEQDFIQNNNQEMLLWGGMTGIMLLVAFAALAVYSASKDKIFLYYGLKLLTLFLSHLSAIGILPLFLWQGQYSLKLLYIMSGFYYIFSAQFVRNYLKTAQITPKLDIALKGIIAFGVISIISALCGVNQIALLALEIGGVGFMLHIIASLYAVRYGVSGAKLFALAWAIYTVSITITWGLRGSALIDHNAFTYRLNSVSIVIEILLFSAAMALRVAEINRQKEHLETVYREQLEKEAYELEALVMQRTQELDLARRDAEAASTAKGNFLAHVSHEIRTPLTSILGYVDRLSHDRGLNQGQMQSLARIADSGNYLLSLISNVLNVSRLEVGLSEVNESPIAIDVLIRQLNALFDENANVKGIQLSLHSASQAEILLDAGKLRQILVNLLGNAIKFTEKGSVSLNLSLQKSAEQDWLIAKVCDTGPGIAASDQQKIFAPFEQTIQGKRAGGAGLGLAISKDFAQLMGGYLELSSQLGQGSEFTLGLPVKIKASAPVMPAAAPAKLGLNGLHILIAEDQSINRELLQDILISYGAAVTASEDGFSALCAWRCDPSIHTVLLDYHMPLMNGMQVSRSLRALGFKGQIILLSAGHAPLAETLSAAGIDQWIEKPFHRETLIATLHNSQPAQPPSTVLNLQAAAEAMGYSMEKCIAMAQKGLNRIEQLLNLVEETQEGRHAHSARGIAAQIGAQTLSECLGQLEISPDNAPLLIQAQAHTKEALATLEQARQAAA